MAGIVTDIDTDNPALGFWVGNQRQFYKDKKLNAHRIRQLDDLGFSWDPIDALWKDMYGRLVAYQKKHGHCRMSARFKTADGYRLGSWVDSQRQFQKNGKLSRDRRKFLEALPGWSWDILDYLWDEGFAHLESFANRTRHCRVARNFRTPDGYKLGVWIGIQKQFQREGRLPLERRNRLESLPGWTWDGRAAKWEKGFFHLKEFIRHSHHCRVPLSFKAEDGFRLGSWVSTQRQTYKVGKLSMERSQRLESLPEWKWKPFDKFWEEGFSNLEAFAKREGHCRVTGDFETSDGFKLGAWVSRQRTSQTKGELSEEHRKRLDALPDWLWYIDPAAPWSDAYLILKTYGETHGHCRVQLEYSTPDGFQLGRWVDRQRTSYKRGALSKEHCDLLEALPGWAWDKYANDWNTAYAHLTDFVKKKGHSRVPRSFKTFDGLDLGVWVVRQRQNADSLEPNKRRLLEALPGWSWDVLTDRWNEAFSQLQDFAKCGHSRVPLNFKTMEGLSLGAWVDTQRQSYKKSKLSDVRRMRLEALPGWEWSPSKKPAKVNR